MTKELSYDQIWTDVKTAHRVGGFEVVEHGWEQHVLVDHEKNIVYRYPRNQNAADKLADEVAVLESLRHTIFNVAIPVLRHHNAQYTVYDYIPGDVIDETTAKDLTDDQAEKIGHDLGIFFSILHATNPEVIRHKSTKQTASLLEYYVERINKAKDADFYAHAQNLLAKIKHDDDDEVVVHGDLHGLNMVIDPISKNLIGIIDFSELELGNRHQDFRKIFMADSRFLDPAISAYLSTTSVSLDAEKVKVWAYVNEWANIAYFKNQPSHPTYVRAQKHLTRWHQM